MLGFLIARNTMHQQQWLAVVEELGGYQGQLPVPNSHPDAEPHAQYAHAYFGHHVSGMVPAGRWTEGQALDGKAQFTSMRSEPLGGEPVLAPPRPDSGAQAEQVKAPVAANDPAARRSGRSA
jgi:Mn-containing catalase